MFVKFDWSVRGLVMRCLVGVSRVNIVKNKELRRRAGKEMELASRADHRVLRWFGMWKEWMSTVWLEGCRWRKLAEGGYEGDRGRLDGWCEGGLGQQRNDGGGCASMRKRSEGVESPSINITE